MNTRIEQAFGFNANNPQANAVFQPIEDQAKQLAYAIDNALPESREKSLALTDLERAMHWVRAATERGLQILILLFALPALALQSPKDAEFADAPSMLRAPMMPSAAPADLSGVLKLGWVRTPNTTGYRLAWGEIDEILDRAQAATDAHFRGTTNFINIELPPVAITNNWNRPQYWFALMATNEIGQSPWSRILFIPPLPANAVLISWLGSGVLIEVSDGLTGSWSALTNPPGTNCVVRIDRPDRFFRSSPRKHLAIEPVP